MERIIAILITLIILIVYTLISYYGIHLTPESSLMFAVMLSFVILNLLYPLSLALKETPDYSLGVYFALELLFLILIGLYAGYISLNDVREGE